MAECKEFHLKFDGYEAIFKTEEQIELIQHLLKQLDNQHRVVVAFMRLIDKTEKD